MIDGVDVSELHVAVLTDSPALMLKGVLLVLLIIGVVGPLGHWLPSALVTAPVHCWGAERPSGHLAGVKILAGRHSGVHGDAVGLVPVGPRFAS